MLCTLSDIIECISSFGETGILSRAHTNLGCLEIKIDNPEILKTSFITHSRLHKFVGMSFLLNNAPVDLYIVRNCLLSSSNWYSDLRIFEDIDLYLLEQAQLKRDKQKSMYTAWTDWKHDKALTNIGFSGENQQQGSCSLHGSTGTIRANSRDCKLAKTSRLRQKWQSPWLCVVFRRFNLILSKVVVPFLIKATKRSDYLPLLPCF